MLTFVQQMEFDTDVQSMPTSCYRAEILPQSLNLMQDLLNHQVSAAIGSDSAEYRFSNSHLSAGDKIQNFDDIVAINKVWPFVSPKI